MHARSTRIHGVQPAALHSRRRPSYPELLAALRCRFVVFGLEVGELIEAELVAFPPG